MTTIDFDRK